jgi:hypothetical protein
MIAAARANPCPELLMAQNYDPNLSPGWERRYIVIAIILILFGIGIIPMSITAYRTGQPIPLLSGHRTYYGWQGFLVTFCCVSAGLAGIWVSTRTKRS